MAVSNSLGCPGEHYAVHIRHECSLSDISGSLAEGLGSPLLPVIWVGEVNLAAEPIGGDRPSPQAHVSHIRCPVPP